MSYTELAVIGVVTAALVDLALLRTKLLRRKAFWIAYGIVLLFQLIVDGVLTGLPMVRYDRSTIIGWRVVNAPIEDLVFGFAMVLLTLATWVWLGGRAARTPPRSTRARPRRPAG